MIEDLHFVDFRHRNGQEVFNHLEGLANEMRVTGPGRRAGAVTVFNRPLRGPL